MITSEFKDTDGYKLRFSEKSSEADKKFFRQKYSKVDAVASEKLHCTTCDMHIGTAPISEKIVRTHMILSVTQCNKCFAFYNSGEFGKGEDGSEYYCRWCGQGGEVFCCASCPFVFCNKCIKSNLSNSYVKEIEENDDWSCFVCNKDILKHQRAQHWALRNFMTKQLEKIQKTTVQSEDELSNLLNEDASNCCPRKKRKALPQKPAAPLAPVKRSAGSMLGGGVTAYPPSKRMSAEVKMPSKPTPPPPQPAKSGNQSSIVCTPDILGLLNGDNETPQPSTSAAVPPPLVMRNNQRMRLQTGVAPAAPGTPGAPPIYHNISGFQIDLNHAARQEIFRLPNGKLIQVRKQATTAPPNGANVRPTNNVNIRGPQFTIRQANSPAVNILNNFIRPVRPQGPQHSIRPRQPVPIQPRFTSHNGRLVATPVHPTPVAPLPAPKPSGSTIFTQQNGTISVARAPQPDTPFGKAKIAFEDKIISGLEICQHTINKMITLSNNTSFKESRSFSDLKDLYIHLQYLFSFTDGKIKTLQEEITAGMGSLESIDTASKEKTTADELEILEEKTDIIEVPSDDDEPAPLKVKAEIVAPIVKAAPAVTASLVAYAPGPASAIKKPLIKHIQYIAKDIVPVPAVVEPTVRIPLERESIDSVRSERPDDKKLKLKTLVKVEKLEDSKNVIVKQYMAKLQERLAAASESGGSSREGTPEFSLLCPETVMAEDENEVAPKPTEEDLVEEVTPEKADENKETEESKDVEAEESNEADVLKIGSAPPLDLMEIAEDGEIKITKDCHKDEETVDIPDDEDDLAEEVMENGEVQGVVQQIAQEGTSDADEKGSVESDEVDETGSSNPPTQLISEMTSDSPSVEFVSEGTIEPEVTTTLTEVIEAAPDAAELLELTKAAAEPALMEENVSVVMLDDSFESVETGGVHDPIIEELPKADAEVENKISETEDEELNKCLEAVLSGDKSVLDSDTFLSTATVDESNAGFNLLGDEANFLGDHSLMEID